MKFNKNIFLVAFLIGSIFVVQISCKKDKAKEITATNTITPSVAMCDTVTYTKHIAPIVLLCGSSGCHDASPRHLITTYAQLKNEINNNSVTISSSNGHVLGNSKDMSLQAGLTSEQNAWLKCWIDKGMPQ